MPAKKAPAATTARPAVSRPPTRQSAPASYDSGEHGGDEQEDSVASKADAFDTAKATGLGIPVGDWEARILEMVIEKKAEKGESVKVTYEATTTDEDSEAYGKKSSQWYQIFDKDGNIGKGVGFLKTDLEKLGVDEEGRKYANLESTLEQISTEQPLVNIKVKQNGQYFNVYLQGLAEAE